MRLFLVFLAGMLAMCAVVGHARRDWRDMWISLGLTCWMLLMAAIQ